MCGIVGYLDKSGGYRAPIGRILLRMLVAVGCRGPDSAGVALYGPPSDVFLLRIKLGEQGDEAERAAALEAIARDTTSVLSSERQGAYLRLAVLKAPASLVDAIEEYAPDVEVVSLGRRLEIVKQIGTPEALETAYSVSKFVGTHGIGHTRLSTESRIDLSHSQPFWAHGLPDVATAHNGHITNYHQLRRRFEQHGVRFYTENDSEVIGVYLRDRMQHGATFEEAMETSLRDFDGSFCYVAATPEALAFVKDPFGLKPLVIAETEAWVAVATEEIALRSALPGNYRVAEPNTGSMRVWYVPQRTPVGAAA